MDARRRGELAPAAPATGRARRTCWRCRLPRRAPPRSRADRVHLDQHARALRLEAPHRRVGAVQVAQEVGRHRLGVLRQRRVAKAAHRAHAGHVDPHVDAPEPLHRGDGGALHRGGVRDVGGARRAPRPPNAPQSAATVLSAGSPRASSTRRAPSRAKARAAARPTPLEAPVITTTADLISRVTGALLLSASNVVGRRGVRAGLWLGAGRFRPPARCPSTGSPSQLACRWWGGKRRPSSCSSNMLGRRAGRAGCICASLGVRPPLRRLQGAQAVTMFSQLVRPPRERGTTWSNVRSSGGAAVLAGEGVAQEQVEPREGRRAVLRDIALQRHHAGHGHLEGRRAHHVVVGGDHAHAVEEHRLDHLLPRPQRQRVVGQGPVVGVEHQRRPAGGRTRGDLQGHAWPPHGRRATEGKASAVTKTGLLTRVAIGEPTGEPRLSTKDSATGE